MPNPSDTIRKRLEAHSFDTSAYIKAPSPRPCCIDRKNLLTELDRLTAELSAAREMDAGLRELVEEATTALRSVAESLCDAKLNASSATVMRAAMRIEAALSHPALTEGK